MVLAGVLAQLGGARADEYGIRDQLWQLDVTDHRSRRKVYEIDLAAAPLE